MLTEASFLARNAGSKHQSLACCDACDVGCRRPSMPRLPPLHYLCHGTGFCSLRAVGQPQPRCATLRCIAENFGVWPLTFWRSPACQSFFTVHRWRCIMEYVFPPTASFCICEVHLPIPETKALGCCSDAETYIEPLVLQLHSLI